MNNQNIAGKASLYLGARKARSKYFLIKELQEEDQEDELRVDHIKHRSKLIFNVQSTILSDAD